MADMGIQFGTAGGVNAQSIGAAPPDCGSKAAPMIGPDGNWVCTATSSGSGLSSVWILVLAGIGWWYWQSKKTKTKTPIGETE